MTADKAVIVCEGTPHSRLSLFNKAFQQTELNQLQGVVETVFNFFSQRGSGNTFYLANGTQHETKRDPGPEPAIFKNTTGTLKVEHMGAVQLRTEQRVNTLKEEQFEVKLFHLMDKQTI